MSYHQSIFQKTDTLIRSSKLSIIDGVGYCKIEPMIRTSVFSIDGVGYCKIEPLYRTRLENLCLVLME